MPREEGNVTDLGQNDPRRAFLDLLDQMSELCKQAALMTPPGFPLGPLADVQNALNRQAFLVRDWPEDWPNG